jgi:glycosyltransferase involved in cell wall biosynthesis
LKILIFSPCFYPSIGGLETVVSILAHEFVEQGHSVHLVSNTPDGTPKYFPFKVFRNPSFRQLLSLTHWCDIYFQPNISLKGIWPLLIHAKPWVISHNGWYTRPNGRYGWQDYLKHILIRFATNISVSQAVAAHVSTPSTVIPNPYEEDIFHEIPDIPRNKELVFLGRLVSDKGVDILIQSLVNLKQMGLSPRLTIVGNGPEEPKLHQLVDTLEISEQVEFIGVKVKQELAQLLNSYQIMVVPSRWQEPFGVVALEGIACGCVVVGSEGGGLKEAIGPCGITFPNEDMQALTDALAQLLTHPEEQSQYRAMAQSHLSKYRKAQVAKAYLQVFERMLQ